MLATALFICSTLAFSWEWTSWRPSSCLQGKIQDKVPLVFSCKPRPVVGLFFFSNSPIRSSYNFALRRKEFFHKRPIRNKLFPRSNWKVTEIFISSELHVFYGLQASPWGASGSSLEFSSSWLLCRYQLCHSTHPYYPPRPCCGTVPPHCPFLRC